jgi:hypothetical protein
MNFHQFLAQLHIVAVRRGGRLVASHILLHKCDRYKIFAYHLSGHYQNKDLNLINLSLHRG